MYLLLNDIFSVMILTANVTVDDPPVRKRRHKRYWEVRHGQVLEILHEITELTENA
jgi:hypothetical protein